MSAIQSLINDILELHKPWTYEIKKLGNLYFCSHCRSDGGRTYVSYPCKTVKIINQYKENV